jgi:hypothetical protein
MSISLNREEGPDGDIDFSIPIATTRFFVQHWDTAIEELGLKLIQENAYFGKDKLKEVLRELALLKEWAIKNLDGKELDYMKSRVEDLETGIPGAFDREDTILYIY